MAGTEMPAVLEQNPKSVLIDRNRDQSKRNNFPTNENSLRVTFAKSDPNQSFTSSAIIMVPEIRLHKHKHKGPTHEKPKKTSSAGIQDKKENPGNAGKNETKLKSIGASNRDGHSEAKPHTPGQSNGTKTGKSQPARKVGKTNKLSNHLLTQSDTGPMKKYGNVANQEEEAQNRAHSAKMRKTTRKPAKFSHRPVGVALHHSRSSKKLKKKKSVPTTDEDDELIQPAQLNAEYISELGKITQILKAVSVFDAATATENPTVRSEQSARVKTTPLADIGDDFVGYKGMNRPLSTGELKQLLSSITRVVSLHQLPVNDQSSNTFAGSTVGLNSTSSVPRVKSRKVKTKKITPENSRREEILTKVRTGASKSKESMRKSRSKKKQNRSKPKRTNSDESSISSSEKDPAKHAAFLKEYYEESTRLAGEKSSEETLTDTIQEQVHFSQGKQSSMKRSLSEKMVNSNLLSKRQSKESVPASLKVTSHLPSSPIQPIIKPFTSVFDGGMRDVQKSTEEQPRHYKQEIPASFNLYKRSEPERGSRYNSVLGKMELSAFSTTAFAGSPKSKSPVGRADVEKMPATDQGQGRSTPTKTKIINTMINTAARQQQIKKIEEVINSKFTGDTSKMKSIWEKTPFLPVTHARFQDMASLYGNLESNTKNMGAEEIKLSSQTTTKANNATSEGLGALTAKENLGEHRGNGRVTNQLQAETGVRRDSPVTAYNRLSYDYRANMRKEARQIRKRFRDDTTRNYLSRPTTKEMLQSSAGADDVNKVLNYYSHLIKRDAKTK